MGLQIVGAGLPRTGTSSLKSAIELLTGQRCYHMFELFAHEAEHIPLWSRVLDGDLDATAQIFDGCAGAIDWPSSAFWQELADLYPDAYVLLSRRDSAATWWHSADRTVWESMRRIGGRGPFGELISRVADRFHGDLDDPSGAMAAYDDHLAEVRSSISPDRLIEMEPSDGWTPLCEALGVEVPTEPFPHTNTTHDFRSRFGWD